MTYLAKAALALAEWLRDNAKVNVLTVSVILAIALMKTLDYTWMAYSQLTALVASNASLAESMGQVYQLLGFTNLSVIIATGLIVCLKDLCTAPPGDTELFKLAKAQLNKFCGGDKNDKE